MLAVVPATEDVANSEALKLAQQVDPTRERTVGVITKCDLMDDGTDCTALLANRTLPLKLGYIAVVNRGQKATVGGQKVGVAQKLEAEYFERHPAYRRHINRCTIPRLASHLNSILVRHIHAVLPDIKQRVQVR